VATDAMPPTAAHWKDRFAADRLTVTAYAPMRWESQLFGVLMVASRDTSAPTWVETTMAMLTEIGSFGGVLIGAQIEELRTIHEQRAEIRDLIDHQRFHPVFQRYVDLATGETRGYEALTRFDDGTRPDRKIHSAWLAGMGEELEAACAAAALEAADDVLAPEHSLSVNFSPLSVLDGTAARVVRDAHRPVVIEVTEHTAIENYDTLRRALQECGPIKVSVDDAGAGFSSLRHILELRPDVVKLDIGLISGIDTDLARQALAAGLCHYADDTGTVLIAEGVETEGEAETVRRLGVDFGQGFYFGRPSPQG
jgi:EAL domain-containing protein (putative c-di-GMP-specific phosphodiesterase class I)